MSTQMIQLLKNYEFGKEDSTIIQPRAVSSSKLEILKYF